MVKNLLLVFSLLLISNSYSAAQVSSSDLESAVDKLHDLLNAKRKNAGVPEFQNEAPLGDAALSQAVHLISSKDLTHDQKNSKRKTPADRVKSEGGDFENVFELLAEITSRESKMKKKEMMANLNAVVDAWLEHEPDLISDKYSHAGISVVYDSRRDLVFCVLVLAKKKEGS